MRMMMDDCEYVIHSTIEGKKYIIAKILYSCDKDNQSETVICKPVKSRWHNIDVQLPDFKCGNDIKNFVNSEYAKQFGITLEKRSKKKSMSPEKRMHYLLEFLKRQTDKNHPLNEMKSIKEYFEQFEEDAKLNSYSTIKKTILELADVLNYDELGGATGRDAIFFEESINTEDEEDAGKKQISRIKNLYYQSEISSYEMDQIIEAIHFSPSIKQKERLISILRQTFTSEHYKPRTDVDSCVIEKKESRHIYDNLFVIQDAISRNCKIKFFVAFYDKYKQLRVEKKSHIVRPYKILSNQGIYYLYCLDERNLQDFFRIEYMSNIVILCEEKNNSYGFKPKETTCFWVDDNENTFSKVRDFTEEDVVGMMDMICINLKEYVIRVYNNDGKSSQEEMHVGYGCLMDTFGNHWEYIKKDEEGFDLVELKANPYAMISWALKNVGRAEIMKPIEERERIKGVIDLLHDIYSE